MQRCPEKLLDNYDANVVWAANVCLENFFGLKSTIASSSMKNKCSSLSVCTSKKPIYIPHTKEKAAGINLP
uniref:Uncharacterized protein n=1 Tax=Romanomermis culicivorax TaxID=13658 RepID=A0A915J6X2_ROMCU